MKQYTLKLDCAFYRRYNPGYLSICVRGIKSLLGYIPDKIRIEVSDTPREGFYIIQCKCMTVYYRNTRFDLTDSGITEARQHHNKYVRIREIK